MKNQICHFEIGVRDQEKAKQFYASVFDWQVEMKEGKAMLRTGGDVGGHLNTLGHEPYNYVVFYIMVDDVAATLEKALAGGGKKIVGPVPLPGAGIFAWFA